MAKHEFGIMKTAPQPDDWYEYYEPEMYDCISIHDDNIESLLEDLCQVKCYWHTLEQPERGLSYYGITIIPPSSFDMLLEILDGKVNLEKLSMLLKKAKEEDKYIIHFGI